MKAYQVDFICLQGPLKLANTGTSYCFQKQLTPNSIISLKIAYKLQKKKKKRERQVW